MINESDCHLSGSFKTSSSIFLQISIKCGSCIATSRKTPCACRAFERNNLMRPPTLHAMQTKVAIDDAIPTATIASAMIADRLTVSFRPGVHLQDIARLEPPCADLDEKEAKA